ncbi:MAG: hypothetical protein ACYC99_11135 [Candidatus Geothermincolia bacterium]
MRTHSTWRRCFRLLVVILVASLAMSLSAGAFSACAADSGIDQFFPPYPAASDGSWPSIRHDPYNSDFTQNSVDPKLNYAASMDPAWQEICSRSYPPVKGATPAEDTGGLDDVTLFASSILDQACAWQRTDSPGNVVKNGTGVLVSTVSKGYASGAEEGSTGYPHVIAYGLDGTLLWTSDEWKCDENNWIDEPGDAYDDFNPDPDSVSYVSPESQMLPSSSVVAGSVILDGQHRVFVSDEKYFWAADAASGDLLYKWRMPSDDPYDPDDKPDGTGLSAPFTTAFFTANGEVGGVHLSGRVTVFPAMETGLHGVIDGASGATYLPAAYKTLPEIYSEESKGVPGVDMTEVVWYPGKVDGQVVDNDMSPERWMMDPTLVEKAISAFAGTVAPVTNTPAVQADSSSGRTRIFVPILLESSTGDDRDAKLMRVDYQPGPVPELLEPWGRSDVDAKGFMPGANGSATSPDIAESGTGVFLVDQNGSDSHLYGFSAESGELLWEPVLVGTMFGSTTTTWDGDNAPLDPANGIDEDDFVYLQAEGKLIEVEQHSGMGGDLHNPAIDFNMVEGNADLRLDDLYRVDSDGDGLEDEVMPRINNKLPKAVISSDPVGSTPACSPEGFRELDLTFPVAVGYQIIDNDLMGHKPETLWPVKVMLITAHRSQSPSGDVTWDWVRLSDLKDTCETSSYPDADGNIWVPHVGTQSSFANGLKDKYSWLLILLGWGQLLRPENDHLAPVEPSGGITKLDVITNAPVAGAVEPSSGKRGKKVTLELSGSDFAANACVELVGTKSGKVIEPLNTRSVSRTEVVCEFDLRGVAPGQYTFRVTNPDGLSAEVPGGFSVKP